MVARTIAMLLLERCAMAFGTSSPCLRPARAMFVDTLLPPLHHGNADWPAARTRPSPRPLAFIARLLMRRPEADARGAARLDPPLESAPPSAMSQLFRSTREHRPLVDRELVAAMRAADLQAALQLGPHPLRRASDFQAPRPSDRDDDAGSSAAGLHAHHRSPAMACGATRSSHSRVLSAVPRRQGVLARAAAQRAVSAQQLALDLID